MQTLQPNCGKGLLKLNDTDLISAGRFILCISAMTLMRLGLTAAFTTVKTPFFLKKKRKNPPSLLIHQLVFVSTFQELVCDKVLTLLCYHFFLQKLSYVSQNTSQHPPDNVSRIEASARIYFSLYSCSKTDKQQNARCINSIFFFTS